MKAIGYIFKSGRKARLNQVDNFPDDFFYGFIHLKKLKLNVSIIEDDEIELSVKRINKLFQFLSIISIKILGIHAAIFLNLIKKSNINKLNSYPVLVATTTSIGMALSLAKRLGILKSEVYFIVMGIVDLTDKAYMKEFILKTISFSNILSISKGEMLAMKRKYSLDRNIFYLPYGVDKDFWKFKPEASKDYVLSIGNDPNRDFNTLIDAWEDSFPTLKIITSLKIHNLKRNIEIQKGSWNSDILTDIEIRKIYQEAKFVIIPLKNTTQPSGQSVCLQAMACGKNVIISDNPGLWDRELINENNGCFLTPCFDSKSLKLNIKNLLKIDKEKSYKLSLNARKVVDNNLNSENTALALKKYIDIKK